MRSVLTAVGLAVCLAQAAPSPRQWTEVRSPDHGFRVEFPAAAGRSEPAPGRVKWSVDLDDGFTAYIAETMTLASERVRSAGPAKVLDDAVAGGIRQFPGATILDDRSIEIGGNPGREFSVRTVYSGTLMHLKSRVVLVGTTLHMLVAVAKDAGRNEAEADRFLNSFALISR